MSSVQSSFGGMEMKGHLCVLVGYRLGRLQGQINNLRRISTIRQFKSILFKCASHTCKMLLGFDHLVKTSILKSLPFCRFHSSDSSILTKIINKSMLDLENCYSNAISYSIFFLVCRDTWKCIESIIFETTSAIRCKST